jgi:hypothetical protein
VATYTVPSAKNVAQMNDGVCWWAGLMVLYQWSQATGGTMPEPNADSDIKDRWSTNKDWPTWNNDKLAGKVSLKTYASVPADTAGLSDFLQVHGPTWTAIQKNWGGNDYSHVVVIAGVRDDGVLIFDPEPVGAGSRKWLTWDEYKTARDGLKTSIRHMTVK